ncbi:FKBP-type peptidyl-prolyl cis-trans isomerase (plasmid) [Enterobacter sp. JBIWA008]|uniref:FKBP-type peptidyl-prolyl cis-trans isomerase N-terminal domain-containing protein n=1 Tax=Enterobacter sp. JBIWA008 TaxID=2831892 RepID=UPI001CBCBCC0|nr:FKBP-type peptidyl-prolyl cis-trans isomerase N-terminal domain-containing protein [Enterobacter sp. JBIWA008]UAN43330.1 FKBP-type peptidyl-prolyl cis-trans isomerase [Enterobacter sp. JBIWA008]
MVCLLLSSLMPAGARAGADNGIPALLGMAAEVPADEIPVTNSSSPARPDLQRLQRQLQVQRKRIDELGRTIVTLNEQLSRQAAAVAPETLTALTHERDENLRQAEMLRRKVQELEQSLAAQKAVAEVAGHKVQSLTTTLREAQSQNTALQDEKASLEKQGALVTAKEQEITQLRSSLDNNKRESMAQQQSLTEQLKEKSAALTSLTDELSKIQTALAEARKAPKRHKPEGPAAVRDYAIGTSLGDDILALLKAREAEGIHVDREMALVGIRDTLTGQLQLPEDILKKTLLAEDKAVATRQGKLVADTRKVGEAYRQDFARRKGVKKHPDGFLYLVDYAGDTAFRDTDFITVSVKESLTSGQVINDMDTRGSYVSQPLNAYPGLFQKALRLLKNHGSITLVVPPELAYGDKGYPPDIPPGATMVYNLRIQGVDSP